MKNKLICLVLASAACFAQSAMAIPIVAGSQLNTGGTLTGLNSTGNELNTSLGLDFTAGGDPGLGILLGIAGTGTFNGVNCTLGAGGDGGICGIIQDINSFLGFTGDANFLSGLPEGINFQLNAPLSVTRAPASDSSLATLILSGTGILTATGFDPSNAIFTLVTQGGINTTYSASIISVGTRAVPEPASMLLFGAGIAGLMLARRKKAMQA